MLWPLLLGVRWVPQAGKGRAPLPELEAEFLTTCLFP